MDRIDIQDLSSHLRQRRMLSGITWTFALGPVLLRTHACARTRTGLLGLQVAMLGHFWIAPFHALHAALQRWAATSCPGTLDAGFLCQDRTESVHCASRVS